MFRRNLFKRVLPVLLSVAMVFQTVPATAMAAEAPATEVAAEADSAAEVLEESTGTTDAGSTDVDDTLPKAVVKVNVENMMANLNAYSFDYTANAIEIQFSKTIDYATQIQNAVKNAVSVSVEDEVQASLKNKLKYTWKKMDASGAYVALAAEEKVQAVGKYQLAVTLPKVEGVCAASEVATINLEIKKAVLELQGVQYKNLDAGLTVAEIKKLNENVNILLNNNLVEKENYVSAIAVSVKEAYTGTVLTDETVLQKNQDYILNFAVTLKDTVKDSYEMGVTGFNITQGQAVATEIVVNYTTPGKVIGKLYDGKELDYDTIVKPEYTAKVVYTKDGEKKDLANAEITGTWCDANKDEMEGAPVDAGTYYYKLSYTDKNNTYADAEAFVRVAVQMINVVINPKLESLDVYENTGVWEILDQVTYDVYPVKGGTVDPTAMEIDEYFWGVSYNEDMSVTQPYEPVFRIQRSEVEGEGENAKLVWNDYYGVIQKDSKYGYRLVFSGMKSVYDRSGNSNGEKDINSAQSNYTVDLSEAMLVGYAKTLNILGANKVDIKVDDILVEGAGATFDKPIAKTYDGADLYTIKGEYKKAAVVSATDGATVASGTDGSITYSWEKMGTNYAILQDENKNIKEPVAPGENATDQEKADYQKALTAWTNLWTSAGTFNDVEVHSSPYTSNVYRLKVSYYDATHKNLPATKYVYYVIKPVDSIITMTGTPAIYADGINTVSTLLYKLQNSDEESVESYVNVDMFPVTLTEGADGKAIVTKGEESLGLSTFMFYNYPTRYFYVEKKIKEGENAGKWEKCLTSEVLEADTEYRLCIGSYNPTNYNFGRKLGTHNQVIKADYYENESVAITIKKTEGVEVEIVVDEDKIKDNVKVYDGKGFDEEALRSLVKVVTKKDKTDVTDKVQVHILFKDRTENYFCTPAGAKHGGLYTPYFYTVTDDTYVATELYGKKDYEVKKKDIAIIPALKEEIFAGKRIVGAYNYYDVVYNNKEYAVEDYTVEGLVEGDESAVDSTTWRVCETDSKNSFTGYLKSGETYYVRLNTIAYEEIWDSQIGQWIDYGRNYQADEGIKAFVPVRDAAYFEDANATIFDDVKKDEKNDFAHTVTTRDGVPVENVWDVEGNWVGRSNYLIVSIYAPSELWRAYNYSFNNGDYVYASSIKAAGGEILDIGYNYITVAFDAAKHETHSFDILWREDYVEHFTVDLSKSILLDDLTQAVAPKSLAFNGVNTKMVVGDTQHLDVKMTKVQMNDVVLLDYKVDNEAVVKVMENGFVTALSKGAATVTVFPCVLNEEGEKVAIAGAKSAKVKITVSDVAAPKINGVVVKDTYATLKYTKPANGYRREVYVLGGKKTAADFEAQIAQVKNGDFSAFTYVNFLNSEATDSKGVVTTSVSYMAPVSEYTVYVRNVSGLRMLDDGSMVAASAAGTVKTFKTIKSQTVQIAAGMDKPAVYNEELDRWEAKLTDKAAQITVNARFLQRYSKDYSDSPDYIWRKLPLAADMKASYTEPKMIYYVSDYNSEYWFENSVYLNGKYYNKTAAIASVDKKGKVTFKGKGEIQVLAIDSLSGRGDVFDLFIDAQPNSLSGKPIKLQAGDTMRLSDVMEYKQGKDKVVNYQYNYADMTVAESSNEYFEIENVYGDYRITALKSGGSMELTVSDSEVTRNGGQAAKVKLTSAVIEPVKNLKVKQAWDDHAEITFTYPLSYYEFRIELRDARGKVILNRVEYLGWDDYDAKRKLYVYTYDLDELTRLSNYNVTVTAQYGGESSKEAKTKIKTTNIPASYENLGKNEYGGVTIDVKTDIDTGSDYLGNVVLKSGNTYTLEVPLDDGNRAARERKTDTLTWKSTNSKVASVKALAGSYTAQLKALKPGTTDIELTSKITKKVIARHRVQINAVGDGNGYFDTNESYNWKEPIDSVDVEECDILAVTMDNQVNARLNRGEGQWFVFVAPAYGRYTINWYGPSNSGMNTYTLQKNAKKYVYLENKYSTSANVYVSVTGTTYQEAVMGDNKIKHGQTFIFTAPEDNYYTFTYTDDNKNEHKVNVGLGKDQTYTLTVWGGTQGREYTVTVTKREISAKLTEAAEGVKISVGKDQEKWYSFTAPETQVYDFTFTLADNTAGLRVERYYKLSYSSGSASTSSTSGIATMKGISLEKGATIYFKVTSASATEEKAVEATAVVAKRTAKDSVAVGGEAKAVTVAAKENAWYSFVVTEKNCYTFRVGSEATGSMSVYLYDEKGFKGLNNDSDYVFTTGSNRVSGEMLLQPGTYYLYFVNSAATEAKADISVTKREITGELSATATDLSIGVIGEVWYSFTAPEDQCYTFRLAEKSADIQAVYYTSKTATSSYSLINSGNSKSSEMRMDAGNTIYVKFTASGATAEAPVTAKVRVTKREVAGVIADSETGTEITVDPVDGEAWYSFTAPEKNRYSFVIPKTDVAFDNDTYYYYDLASTNRSTLFSDNKLNANTINTSNSVSLEEGQTIYIKFASSKGTAEAPAKANVKVFRPTLKGTLTEGAAGNAISVGVNGESWYKFTATEDNYYTFTWVAKDGASFSSSFDAYSDIVDGNYAAYIYNGNEVLLQKDQTIYLPFRSSSATLEKNAEATVTVTKREVKVRFSTTTAEEVEFTGNGSSNSVWCSYTAAEAGTYVFSTSCSRYLYWSAYEKITDGGNIAGDSFSGERVFYGEEMTAGETVFFKLYVSSGATQESPVKINVKVSKVSAVESLALGGEGTTVSVTEANTYKWYSFTATEDNVYAFTFSDVTGASAKYCTIVSYKDGIDEIGTIYSSSELSMALRKGDVGYIAIYSSAATTDSPSFMKVTVSKDRTYEGELDCSEAGKQIVLTKGNTPVYYTFTAPEDNIYSFEFSDAVTESPEGTEIGVQRTVIESTGITRYLYATSTKPLQYKNYIMKKGEVAIIGFVAPGGISEENTFKLTAKVEKQLDSSYTLAVDNTVQVHMDEGEQRWYTLTVPETGEYRIVYNDVEGDGEVRVFYSLDGKTDLDSYDAYLDSGTIYTPELKKGQKIYFHFKRYGSYSTSEYDFSVKMSKVSEE